MHTLRLVIAILCLAVMAFAVSGSALADETCTWVGDNEVCVPPR